MQKMNHRKAITRINHSKQIFKAVLPNLTRVRIPGAIFQMNLLLKIRENLVDVSSTVKIIFVPKSIKMEATANIFWQI